MKSLTNYYGIIYKLLRDDFTNGEASLIYLHASLSFNAAEYALMLCAKQKRSFGINNGHKRFVIKPLIKKEYDYMADRYLL